MLLRMRSVFGPRRNMSCGSAATTSLTGHHRHGLNLEQCAGPRETRDRNGGAGRRCRSVDVAVAHFTKDADVRNVDEVVVELHHMLEAGTDRGERILEVDEGLLGLGAEIARRTDDPVVDVEAKLARNVDDPAGARGLHHMGVSGRLPDGWGIVKAMDGHWCPPFERFNDGEAIIVEFWALLPRTGGPAGTSAKENHPSVSFARTSWAIDKEAVNPGDSIPNKCTIRGKPWPDCVSIMKSAAGSPRPVSFGRIPA